MAEAPRSQWWPAANEPNVVARFEYQDQLDVKASKEADEHKYKQIIVCRTKVVGDPDENVLPVKPFNQRDLMARFPDAWKAFNGEEIPVNGTPLTELGLSESEIVNYRINAIYVVEQVATLSDAQCEMIGFGTRKKREAAVALLAKQKQDAEAMVLKAAAQMVPDVDKHDQALAAGINAALSADSPRKKRGRPSKAELAARQAEADAA